MAQSKTKKDLMKDYNISKDTLRKWLNKIPGLSELKSKRIFSPLEVEKIYSHLGVPGE